jgi:uncharacterized protein DUF4232
LLFFFYPFFSQPVMGRGVFSGESELIATADVKQGEKGMRIRAVVVGASTPGLAVGLTACGAAATTGQARTGAGSAAVAEHQGATDTTDAVVAGNDTATDTGTAAPLTAEFSVQRADVAMITLTNNGNKPVTVRGWPELRFTNAHGDTLTVPVEKVEVPAPATAITVAPGSSIFAPVAWASGDKADLDTFVADGVAVVPPGAGTAVTTTVTAMDGSAPGYYEFRLKSVRIGTFQDSTHNILSF